MTDGAPELPPILQAALDFRNAALRMDAQSARRLVDAYGRAYQRLSADIDALTRALAEMGQPLRWQEVQRLTLLKNLREQIAEQIGRFAVVAGDEIAASTSAAVAQALRDSAALVQLSLPGMRAFVSGTWIRLAPAQVETMLGFLAPTSPLYANLQRLGPEVAALVMRRLEEGIILGYNPRKVAALIQRATGLGLTWTLQTTRTANLWAYREATRQNYLANSHVVKGWVWYAQIGDPRTCPSCIALHGTEHTLDEVLNDHHQGRCSMLPITRSFRELGIDQDENRPRFPTGREYWDSLSDAERRALIGPAMFRAYQSGAVTFEDFSREYESDVYGPMRGFPSLRELLGGDASQYYGR